MWVTFYYFGYKYQIIILKFKQIKMKKVILAMAIVSVTFAACNGTETKDAPKVDTPAVVAPVVDTTPAAAPVVDTTKK